MKKLITLLIAFMLALSFNAMATEQNWNTFESIDPSVDGPTYKLDVITIDFGHQVCGKGMMDTNINGVTLTKPDGNTINLTITAPRKGHRQTSVDEFLRFSRKCGIDGT